MITPDTLSIDSLGLPKTEDMVRFFPEAREAAIVMMDSGLMYMMPDELANMGLGFFIIGYVACKKANWKPM